MLLKAPGTLGEAGFSESGRPWVSLPADRLSLPTVTAGWDSGSRSALPVEPAAGGLKFSPLSLSHSGRLSAL